MQGLKEQWANLTHISNSLDNVHYFLSRISLNSALGSDGQDIVRLWVKIRDMMKVEEKFCFEGNSSIYVVCRL